MLTSVKASESDMVRAVVDSSLSSMFRTRGNHTRYAGVRQIPGGSSRPMEGRSGKAQAAISLSVGCLAGEIMPTAPWELPLWLSR